MFSYLMIVIYSPLEEPMEKLLPWILQCITYDQRIKWKREPVNAKYPIKTNSNSQYNNCLGHEISNF